MLGHAVVVQLQEIEKYNAVQPLSCSTLRSHSKCFGRPTEDGIVVSQNRELAS
jgi:hypothetical protein